MAAAGSSRKPPATLTEQASSSDLLRRAFKAKSEWSDKDDILDVVYWIRQVMGLILGVIWGLIPVYGIIGLIIYVAFSTGIIHLYVTSFQQVDEDTLGGFWELAKEGFMSGFATFLICWIIVYSALYHNS